MLHHSVQAIYLFKYIGYLYTFNKICAYFFWTIAKFTVLFYSVLFVYTYKLFFHLYRGCRKPPNTWRPIRQHFQTLDGQQTVRLRRRSNGYRGDPQLAVVHQQGRFVSIHSDVRRHGFDNDARRRLENASETSKSVVPLQHRQQIHTDLQQASAHDDRESEDEERTIWYSSSVKELLHGHDLRYILSIQNTCNISNFKWIIFYFPQKPQWIVSWKHSWVKTASTWRPFISKN